MGLFSQIVAARTFCEDMGMSWGTSHRVAGVAGPDDRSWHIDDDMHVASKVSDLSEPTILGARLESARFGR